MNYLSVQRSHAAAPFYYPTEENSFPVQNQNNNNNNNQEKTLQEIWTMNNFKNKSEPISLSNVKMCWIEETPRRVSPDEPPPDPPKSKEKLEKISASSPSHHARRPPNAFLIFCKKHRPIVRQRFPNLENRGVTKILGEWWALLDDPEKSPYNRLAKEYKDAFLTANPNFKWYKLPAPPLRTLSTRPVVHSAATQNSKLSSCAEFTPGKLADESQLGGLSSLMKMAPVEENSRPPKRRFEDEVGRGKEEEDEDEDEEVNVVEEESRGRVTKQDLMNKVVDGIFTKSLYDTQEKNGLKEVRKSERMCKGKRYEMFMQEGKLLSSKREIRPYRPAIVTKIETELNNYYNNNNNNNNVEISKKPETTPKLDLSETIKRLAERTNVKIEYESAAKRTRTVSENSDQTKTNFNLDLRIANLPCLAYDEFLQRKRDNKKRKARVKNDNIKDQTKTAVVPIIGSKKRKNKSSITHIGKSEETNGIDLLGLATLAEVAANTEKLGS